MRCQPYLKANGQSKPTSECSRHRRIRQRILDGFQLLDQLSATSLQVSCLAPGNLAMITALASAGLLVQRSGHTAPFWGGCLFFLDWLEERSITFVGCRPRPFPAVAKERSDLTPWQGNRKRDIRVILFPNPQVQRLLLYRLGPVFFRRTS